ncbi:DnaJ sub C member 12 [Coemansia brasiliensis]|uniref:DnaJ sub C member 12 n=1 Tax=Coemansia brasiliensis TaxID=2650707 RepID=A0A9W8I9U8_9FUNG|nr:DnaJ sub C member 12 [Coemansia brasiliensis]
MADFYDVLGCNPRSEASEIQKQFRKRALELHPDKDNQGHGGSEWNLIREAYEVLGSASSRAQYDRWRSAALPIPFSQWQQQQQSQTIHWTNDSHRFIGHPSTSQSASSPTQQSSNSSNQDDLYALFRSYKI